MIKSKFMDKVYIYGLYTSIDDRIRYVGKSVNPDNRLRDHLKEALEDADKIIEKVN